MSSFSYIGLDRINNNVQVTGSLSVDGAIQEKGYSIPALLENMVVSSEGSDGSSTISILNFVPISTNDGEVVVT
ncbi:MAG: hypothetical protein H8E03_00765 [Pelagibacteraceae bacterium]|nr:hypothetical protein [Pelagibacteraceae bacterium]